MNVNINDKERYIPTACGNDKEAEPIVFNLRFLTVGEIDEEEYYEVKNIGKNKIVGKVNRKDLFSRGVESIENCIVNGKPIESAADFLAVRGSKKLALIMQDVADHIHAASEIDEKNS